MGNAFRSIRSGWRLGIGGILLGSALRRGRAPGECMNGCSLISVDVFGTLLARRGDDDAAWCEGTLHAAEMARIRGLTTKVEPVALRRAVNSVSPRCG